MIDFAASLVNVAIISSSGNFLIMVVEIKGRRKKTPELDS